MQATGGGAYKYADLFKEKFGVRLDKEDEMDCLVAGSNFLLKVRICDYIWLLHNWCLLLFFHLLFVRNNILDLVDFE